MELKSKQLFQNISHLIAESREHVAATVNALITALYWQVGNTINSDVLKNNRAEYGKHVIHSLSQQLQAEFGDGWSEKHLRHCMRFAEVFPDPQIVSTLWRQLT